MIRDDTPTNPISIDILAAQLEAFKKDPSDGDLFVELRMSLRRSGHPEVLAEICELRAPLVKDRARAARLWAEAGEARLLLGHEQQGDRDLRTALDFDPGNERACARLTERLMVEERFAEAAALLEDELEALRLLAYEGRENTQHGTLRARRAQRHRMAAQLWDERLGRVDRALEHYQKAWQLEPDRIDTLESARKIYASLGEEEMVIQLFEAELAILEQEGDRNQKSQVHRELGRLFATNDPEEAARHLELALELNPDSRTTKESLAEIYASPAFVEDERAHQRAVELFITLGQQRISSGEPEEAIVYLRRALGVDPYLDTVIPHLESALRNAERWDELDRLYRHRTSVAESDDELRSLLEKRADLYRGALSNKEGLKECLVQLSAASGPGNAFTADLRQLYREDHDWQELAQLIETEAQAAGNRPADEQVPELLELATIYREHLRDRDRAAELLHHILTIDPKSEQAQSRYADHFRERRDWRGLADLNRFAIDSLREDGASPRELIRRLEDLAQICEVRLGDVNRAIEAWQSISELEPQNSKASEALRRLLSRAKMWDSLVGVLEQEASQAQSQEQRFEALRRIAQVYRERQINHRRAIELYEEVLAAHPNDEGILKALGELYEREGDDAGLANTLRRQLQLEESKIRAELGQTGVNPRDWPVAKRVERLTSLRRLASMYEERLADVEGVVFASSGVLEILPGDRDALERMERVLDKAGDLARLEQTLEYHAASATGPAEQAKVLRRLAGLAQQRQDEMSAMQRFEAVIKVAPNDHVALSSLSDLYERHKRWADLATILERTLFSKAAPAAGSAEAAKYSADLKRYARVVDARLGDPTRALRAWKAVTSISPKDREALSALAEIYEQQQMWRELADVLAVQAPLYKNDDDDQAAEIAFRRAELLEERLGAPGEAARALEEIVQELDPSNLDAHRSLRRLYEARGDFEAAVRIAEREMYLSDQDQQRMARGLEIGLLCRDRLNDPARALQAFSRVLELSPNHGEALYACSELHERLGNWSQLNDLLERRLAHTEELREQRAIMHRIAQNCAERLGDQHLAFDWYEKAHSLAPDASTMAELRRAAESYGLWRQLVAVYESEREKSCEDGKVVDVFNYVVSCRQLSVIAESRLDDPERAVKALHDALKVAPDNRALLAEAERIAAEVDSPEIWNVLLECHSSLEGVADRDGLVAIYSDRARIFEDRLGDHDSAFQELLRAFSWSPKREDTRRSIYELAERTKRWNEVVSIEAALTKRAPNRLERIQILRRKAQVLEDKVVERVRAFRAHLEAFLIAPEDADTVAHLWRLARAIAEYREGEQLPPTEPPPAYVQAGQPASSASGTRSHSGASALPHRADPTQEINISDLLEGEGVADGFSDDEIAPPPRDTLQVDSPVIESSKAARNDSTMQLDISDLMDVGSKHRSDPTMELRTEDLIEALGARGQGPTAPPSMPGLAPLSEDSSEDSAKGPPPPPRKRPTFQKMAKHFAKADNMASTAPPPAPPKLSIPRRSYASPWEEFATAYLLLPAETNEHKLRWLFRAAEVWETGAAKIDQAFDTLAEALQLKPDYQESRDRLHRLAKEHKRWDRLAHLYLEAAEAASTGDDAVKLYLEVAEIRKSQDKFAEAEVLYRKVLGMRPDDRAARESLEALFRSQKRWVDLAASLEERTDPRLGSAAPESVRPALLRELADIYDERLSRYHDAIDARERLHTLEPDNLNVLRSIADLNEKTGRWSQVISTLARLADIAEVGEEAHAALRRIASIYETKLELPDRAIEAHLKICEQWPDDSNAYAALDSLYASLGRWKELADTLKRRIALSRDSELKAALLKRRAELHLQWLDDPNAAAQDLRHGRTLSASDDELTLLLVDALVRGGRPREAVDVLRGHLSTLEEKQASSGELAAVLIRLAGLVGEKLEDPAAAKLHLDRALELVPNHPTALATVSRLAEFEHDPVAYANARMAEANALKDADHQIEAWLDAGRTYRDRCDLPAQARQAFEAVLTLRPYHSEATWALSSLIESGGDFDSASKLLEKQLEDEALTSPERAADRAKILTQLGALSRSAGLDSMAEERLDEALRVKADYLPAIFAKADLFGATERHARELNFLEEVIPTLDKLSEADLAELKRRHALAYENLGEGAAAYEILLEADRLDRSNIRVKLALGENRYKARRWREAALHLSALAEHPQASSYPSGVAEGLYHAALAEIRSLRPEKAEQLYEKALGLKANFGPALRALAEVYLERGNTNRANQLLARQAEASDDPSERIRLFESLGDTTIATKGKAEDAKSFYERAVASASPIEGQHVELLQKLLEQQNLCSDHQGAGQSAELLASFSSNASEKAMLLKTAAESYRASDDLEKAREVAERALNTAPYDVTAVSIASEIAMGDEDYEATAAMLGRALSKDRADMDDSTAARLSLLWERLGEARQSRGDEQGAAAAYENSVKLAPESDGALLARRQLSKLWTDDEGKRQEVLEYSRIVAAESIDREDVARYARALIATDHTDGARVALSLAAALGHEPNDQDVHFLTKHPPRTMAEDEAYGGSLTQGDRQALLSDSHDEPLASILAALWEASPLLWSDHDKALEDAGASNSRRVGATTTMAAVAIYTRISNALNAPGTVLFATDDEEAPDIQVLRASPPILVVGPRLQGKSGKAPSDLELRFLLARAAELSRPERIFAAHGNAEGLTSLLGRLKRLFGQAKSNWTAADEEFRKDLPVKVRSKLDSLIDENTKLNGERYLAACQRAADRAGLLICGDLDTALRLATKDSSDPSLRHLHQMPLSEEYLVARAHLGLAAR